MTNKKDDKKVRAIRADVEIISPDDEDALPPPNLELVAYLKVLLKQAEEGMLQEMAFALLYADYTSLSDFAGEWDNPSAMIGELEVVKQNYRIVKHPNTIFPILGYGEDD